MLATTDHSVTIYDSLTYAGNLESIRDVLDERRTEFVHADICDTDDVAAGNGGPRRRRPLRCGEPRRPFDRGRFEVRAHELHGNQRAVRRGRTRWASASSCTSRTDEVYGSVEEGSVGGDRHPGPPFTVFGLPRPALDLIALSYFSTYGLPVVVTRCSNNYGPYQFPEKVIPLFTTNLLDGKQVPLYGDGLNVRDWIHVEDHNIAAHLVLDQGVTGEIYNIGAGNEVTNVDLTHRLLELTGSRRVVHPGRSRIVSDTTDAIR